MAGGEDEVRRLLDPEALRCAGDALLLVVHPDKRRQLAITLDNFIGIHANGQVRVSHMLGFRQVLRKAMREAWQDGVHTPLARSRNALARAVLEAMPDGMPLKDHEELSRSISERAEALPEQAEAVITHLARAQAYLAAVPVLLDALERLDELRRVHEAAEDRSKDDQRGRIASRRVRQAFMRGSLPVLERVAAMADRQRLGCVGAVAYAHASRTLRDAPATAIRLRDPARAAWLDALSTALTADVVGVRAGPFLEALFQRHPKLGLEKSSVAKSEGLSGVLVMELSYGDAELVMTHRFDLEAGTLTEVATGKLPRAAPVDMDLDSVSDFLAEVTPPEAVPAPVRRMGR